MTMRLDLLATYTSWDNRKAPPPYPIGDEDSLAKELRAIKVPKDTEKRRCLLKRTPRL